jgi:hypothetical protein
MTFLGKETQIISEEDMETTLSILPMERPIILMI